MTDILAPPTRAVLCALVALATGCAGSELGNLESERHGSVSDPVPKERFDAELRAACGPDGGVTAAGEGALSRWPYLQKMTDHSVAIMWTTDPDEPPATLRVKTPDGALIAQVPAAVDLQSRRPGHTQYATTIEGLEPDTIYCYEIAGEATWLEPVGFKTAPAPGSDEPIRIVALGDVGTRTSDQLAIRDQIANVGFDLVMVAGDLAYDDGTLADHERNFFEVYRELLLSKPFFVVPGNHDYAGDGAVFREVFGQFENGGPHARERWYSLDWGPVHITAVDTQATGEAQTGWVSADLTASDRPHKLVLMHGPLYSSGWHGSSALLQDTYAEIFERTGVDLVLAGHDHDYERTAPIDGVTYVITGSGGRGTRPVGSSDFTAYAEEVAHFTHLTIDGERIELHAIDGLGGDFDAVTIRNEL